VIGDSCHGSTLLLEHPLPALTPALAGREREKKTVTPSLSQGTLTLALSQWERELGGEGVDAIYQLPVTSYQLRVTNHESPVTSHESKLGLDEGADDVAFVVELVLVGIFIIVRIAHPKIQPSSHLIVCG